MDNTKERKQLIIYIAIAYGVTYLMGLLMWYGNSRQLDLTTFPTAQMFYPAAGVMAAILCTKKDDAMVPRLFYWFFVLATVVMAALAVLSICKPNEIIIVMGTGMSLWAVGQQYLMIAVCVVGWVLLLITKKKNAEHMACVGIREFPPGGIFSFLCCCILAVLRFLLQLAENLLLLAVF